MNKLSKILAILTEFLATVNLILYTSLFISLFFIDYDANSLRYFAILSTFIVLMDLIFDLLGSRKTKIKRKAKIEMIYEIENEFNKRIKEKQGEKQDE